jgi:hypothetical protein
MSEKDRDQTKHDEQRSPRPYKTPRLIKYGTVPTLTASGSAGNTENFGQPGTNRRP